MKLLAARMGVKGGILWVVVFEMLPMIMGILVALPGEFVDRRRVSVRRRERFVSPLIRCEHIEEKYSMANPEPLSIQDS